MTIRIMVLNVTNSFINDIAHYVTLTIDVWNGYAECHRAECRYAECRFAECDGAVEKPSKEA
jgi:hypothetical protein